MLSDLREYQHKVKDLKVRLERTEVGELEAKGEAHDCQLALVSAETSLHEKIASSNATINSFQQEIRALKTQ